MKTSRLEAFSDGVIAIIITIMVLELKTPHGEDWPALRTVAPAFWTYALSFVFVGIYWNNHHHMLHASERVTGAVLWANLHLLFWMSLFPFATAWMGDSHLAPVPTALYGIILMMAGVAYYILKTALIAAQGPQSRLAEALGSDFKGRISVAIYLIGVIVAFVNSWIAAALYIGVALMWLVPDPRIERRIASARRE
jgi:uncharacterized membrane protein